MTTPEGAQLARYHRLVQVLAELARSRGLEAVVQTVHRQAETLFDTQVTLLALLASPHEWVWELYEGQEHTTSRLPFYPEGILEQVLLSGPLSIPDIQSYLAEHPARVRRVLSAEEVSLDCSEEQEDDAQSVQCMVLVPLEVGGQRVGVLSLQTYRTHAFDATDLLFLELLGQHVSIALENARLHTDLERVTLTDPLTELPNRRAFTAQAGRALAGLTAGGEPCTLVVVDIRQFKRINDTCGHDAGDEVLILVGAALQGALGPGDAAFRLGGDEFALLLRGEEADLTARAERLNAALRGTAWPCDVGPVCLNAGAASGRAGDTLQGWFRRADRRMYRAKRACAAERVPECGLDFGVRVGELLPG